MSREEQQPLDAADAASRVQCKMEGRSFLAAQVPVERSQEETEFGCDLEECNVYRYGLPSVSSVQHVALCSFILSVVHLVAQLWDSSYMWQRDDFSFPVVFQCYPMWILQRIVLSRQKVWRATLLTLSRVLLESPLSGLCFNEMAGLCC